jgi:hypothetical protein
MIPAEVDKRAEPKDFLSRLKSKVISLGAVEWNLYLLCEGVDDTLRESPHFVSKLGTPITIKKVTARRLH